MPDITLLFKNNIKKLAMAAEVELEGDVIVLSNGAELHFLSTNSSTSQGRSGDVIIDSRSNSFISLYSAVHGVCLTVTAKRIF